MSLSTRVLIGLLLGVAAGIFLGEEVEPISVVGDAFLLLLQMTVLQKSHMRSGAKVIILDRF